MSIRSDRSVRRYEIPVGPEVTIELSQPGMPTVNPLRVEGRPDDPGTVEFWDEHIDDGGHFLRTFQIFGTGHPIPDGAQWRGTTARTPEGLVWHLFEIARGDR